ncbi:T9SS type B sorting domain-containing protein [Panacibacter ginsenosidivorans]|uniref:T9SS type B sorting domain-containing protein n=1 Tax=Panacibacter ginsenosidivorans TaxID=1813871 RepID=A0A5B8V5P5_9BACT|nr:gliding motility-associated C-terminal domain-containing protein [Panacibacter ginsenosidivorans]QEC66542.1 T9SS type B sorting domain-containing protein [Panacibacter ginsenosidivorans]
MSFIKYLCITICYLFLGSAVSAQPCSALGQTPSTAFPVCGVDTFSQTIVPPCSNRGLAVPGCDPTGASYADKNPFWYRFTCFASGDLSFTITPTDLNDDYDWQLYDITGHNPDDVYTNASLVVTGNWSGSYGLTGAKFGGSSNIECASIPTDNVPTFSQMPYLEQGHTYLLMVSHYTDSQIGYKLSFGGSAGITDPLDPDFASSSASCDGSQIRVKLNKKMKCKTLATDGSDFFIKGALAKIKSAEAIGCDNSFEFDSLIVTLQEPLTAGTYQLVAKNGIDSNTVLDNCDRGIAISDEIDFTVYKVAPIPIGDLTPVQCAPDMLQFTFIKNIRCNSIAQDGSDFIITGPHSVNVASAEGVCVDGLSRLINVKLASPVVLDGTYTIQLVKGSDGNTAIDECGEEVIEGAKDFTVKDTVSANFTYELIQNCADDQVNLFNNGGASITSWKWYFDNVDSSSLQNPVKYYSGFGSTTINLSVTNGFCSDTAQQVITLPHDELDARFYGPAIYCPGEVAVFKDSSIGNIVGWLWSFGNGHTSNLQVPPAQTYYTVEREKLFPVQLIVQSNRNCFDTSLQYLKVASNCHIAVPTAFTPNGDGVNDYLYPLNAYEAIDLTFSVYNQFGQRIYLTRDWTQKWDGSFNGHPQPTGVYVWMLQYKDLSGKALFFKGTTVLMR